MERNDKSVPESGIIILFLVLVNVIAIKDEFIGNGKWNPALTLGLPLLLMGISMAIKKYYAKSK
jgi:hypothetical protein